MTHDAALLGGYTGSTTMQVKKSISCLIALALVWTSLPWPAFAQSVRVTGPVRTQVTGIAGLPHATRLEIAFNINGFFTQPALLSAFSVPSIHSPQVEPSFLKPERLVESIGKQLSQPSATLIQIVAGKMILAALADPEVGAQIAAYLGEISDDQYPGIGKQAAQALSTLMGSYSELAVRSAAAKAILELGLDIPASFNALFDGLGILEAKELKIDGSEAGVVAASQPGFSPARARQGSFLSRAPPNGLDQKSETVAPAGGVSASATPSPPPEASAGPRSRPGRLAAELRAKTRVFQDPGRNKNFWRFFLGYQFAVAGLQFFSVAFPYLIKSFAHNAIPPGAKAAMSDEDFASRVNRWRSMVSALEVGAKILSYLSISFLAHRMPGGNKKLLVRAGLLWAAALILVPLHFFVFSGWLPAAVAFAVLALIFAAQGFFGGIHGGMTDAVASDLIGSPDVTKQERDRANSVLAFMAALVSIVVPVLAGKLAQIPDIMGRAGSGSALLFAAYAAVMALSSAFYALSAVRAAKAGWGAAADGRNKSAVRVRARQVLTAVFRNRFLRTLLLLDGFAILISAPLMFSVLPNYVEGVLKASAGSLNHLAGIPVIGWLFDGLMNTPMGYFGLLVAFGSVGSALASALNKFVLGFLQQLGYASEESRLLPLYGIAFLEVFAFAGMVLLPSFWPVFLFWMAKSLFGGFVGLSRQGVYQKNLAAYPEVERPAVIAALSLANLLMTLGGTLVYFFLLSAIPLSMSMTIAVAAIAALGLLRLGAPALMFGKAQRSRHPPGQAPAMAAPEPSLGHLQAMTDTRGIFEHATRAIPNKMHGYASEDVGRALVAALMFNQHRPGDATAAALAGAYMDYLRRAQTQDGDFRHRLSAQGRWSEELATEDAYGRVLWGLGYGAAYPVDRSMGARAGKIFDQALLRTGSLKWPRAMAYSILGLHHYLEAFPQSPQAGKMLIRLADKLLGWYDANSAENWQWFEDVVTYDNAKLSQALFLAYRHTGDKKYLAVAGKTLDFLIKVNFPDGNMLQIIGNKGWYPRGGKPALFDQQPIDAAALVEALAEAHRVTGLPGYAEKMQAAFAWFMGRNILATPLYDAATGGSRDGLNAEKVNENEGAESSIEFLIAQLTLLQTSSQISSPPR